MCTINGIIFGVKNLTKEDVKGKRIIEVGSYNVNGNLGSVLKSWEPAEYIGTDIEKGPGVDVVCNAEDLSSKFGKESFDVVISTEVLEHVRDWRKVISNIKDICKPNGIILLTTRSYGFVYHSYPHDFWRYEIEDMKEIFSDCEIISLEKDPEAPGVFIKAKKPVGFVKKDLLNYKLYSMVTNKKTAEISEKDFRSFYFMGLTLKKKVKDLILRLGFAIYKV
jgi:SAM-dependent methyltransferase